MFVVFQFSPYTSWQWSSNIPNYVHRSKYLQRVLIQKAEIQKFLSSRDEHLNFRLSFDSLIQPKSDRHIALVGACLERSITSASFSVKALLRICIQ